MKELNLFLNRFKNLKAPVRTVQKSVQEAIEDVLQIPLESNTIKVVSKTIYITTHSVIKNAIFENKNHIIARINNILGKDQIKELK